MGAYPSSPDKLKLQTNIPETIALEFADGRTVSSTFGGDQVMYSLVDGRKWFISPYVADKIAAAGIRAGEYFRITKRELAQGNKRIIDYVIETETGSAATEPASNQPSVMQSTAAAPVPAAAAAAAAPGFALDASIMNGCYTTAVDVALAATAYAKERGLLLSPTFEDVRSLAATFYIAQSKGGRA